MSGMVIDDKVVTLIRGLRLAGSILSLSEAVGLLALCLMPDAWLLRILGRKG